MRPHAGQVKTIGFKEKPTGRNVTTSRTVKVETKKDDDGWLYSSQFMIGSVCLGSLALIMMGIVTSKSRASELLSAFALGAIFAIAVFKFP
jgi:hypothetical protein